MATSTTAPRPTSQPSISDATVAETPPPETPTAVWTIDAVRRLGATTDVETAGAILGIGRSKAYQLAKTGQFPVRILRIGRRYLIPTPSIHEYLGIK